MCTVSWTAGLLDCWTAGKRAHSASDRQPSAFSLQPRNPFGFTLIEILVVIVIIGVIVSVVTLSVGVLGRDEQAEEEARRLWTVLQQAREEGEMQARDIGMFMSRDEYEFLRFDNRRDTWLVITDDDLYRSRQLPEGLRFRVWLDSREIVLKPSGVNRGDAEEDKKYPPQVMMLSSGDTSPFRVEFERENEQAIWRVVGLDDNNLRLERRDDRDWTVVEETKPPEDDGRLTSNRQ